MKFVCFAFFFKLLFYKRKGVTNAYANTIIRLLTIRGVSHLCV